MENLEQLRCSGLFDARVPRYTSYPPADRFVAAEGKLFQQDWLRAVPAHEKISLYIHVPYCENLCWFCACRTQAADRQDVVSAYIDIIQKELAQVSARMPSGVRLARLYIGGGTPTLLAQPVMDRLLDDVFAAFPKAVGFEGSIEIDTTQVREDLIHGLIARGMNRAIVGVQDFDPNVQKQIGRRQSFDQTLKVVRKLRRAGLEFLDMELLYGLPSQSSTSIAETTQQVLAMDPDRLAVCEYVHVPNLAKRQIMIDARHLPAAEDAFVMSQVARHILVSDGYEPIGIDHYARPDDTLVAARNGIKLQRDFQGYSDNASYALIGLGASAISRFPQGFVQNLSATSLYTKSIRAGVLAGHRGYAMTHADQVIGKMIEMLMCQFRIDRTAMLESYPDAERFVDTAFRNLSRIYDPYLEITDDSINVKPMAHPLARMMCYSLEQLSTPA